MNHDFCPQPTLDSPENVPRYSVQTVAPFNARCNPLLPVPVKSSYRQLGFAGFPHDDNPVSQDMRALSNSQQFTPRY
jgi:hypothetical protein